MSEPDYDPDVERFARLVLRQFSAWKALTIEEDQGVSPRSWYRMTISSPGDGSPMRLTGDGGGVTVAWFHWQERFDVTSMDHKDPEFVQLINLLTAIDAEEAILIEEFSGDRWIRSQIFAVQEDGTPGIGGALTGAPKAAFWRRPTRREIHSWKGTFEQNIGDKPE